MAADTIGGLLARAEASIEEVGLIKMDVEGSELRALTGAAASLAAPGAPPIVYESNPMTAEPFGYSVDGIRTALEALGYRTYRRLGDAVFACPPTEAQPEAWVDLLALKPEQVARLGLEVDGQLQHGCGCWSCSPNGRRSRIRTCGRTSDGRWPGTGAT